MRVLITTDLYEPAVNGVVTSVRNLRNELSARGHDVRVLTLSESRHSYEAGGVTHLGSVSAGKIYPGARMRSALSSDYVQQLVAWQPEIIHSQCELSTFLTARRLARILSIPIVHTYHTVYEDYTHYFMPSAKWGKSLVASFSRRTLNHCASVIAPTDKVRSILRGYGVTQPIHVVPTGIDVARFAPSPPADELAALRMELGIPNGFGVLLALGRLAREKNLEELLGYLARPGGTPVVLVIVGDGPSRAELEARARELGVGHLVRFTGMVNPELVSAYYHLADLFVSASRSETQGLTYIEALAAGLPALCRQDPCLDGVIDDGGNGWQYRDERDFQEKLATFFGDADLRERMSEHAALTAQGPYSSAGFGRRIEEIYAEVLGHSRLRLGS